MINSADNRFVYVSFYVDSFSRERLKELYDHFRSVFEPEGVKIVSEASEIVVGFKVPKTTSVRVMKVFFNNILSVFETFAQYEPHFTQIRTVERAMEG